MVLRLWSYRKWWFEENLISASLEFHVFPVGDYKELVIESRGSRWGLSSITKREKQRDERSTCSWIAVEWLRRTGHDYWPIGIIIVIIQGR